MSVIGGVTSEQFVAGLISGGLARELAERANEICERYIEAARRRLPVLPEPELPEVLRYVRRLPGNWREIRIRIFERDGEVCRYCATTAGPFHIDHIMPIRRGGSHEDDNLCVACSACNISKGAKTPEEWGRTCS